MNDVDSVLGLLHRVDVVDAADVSEVPDASIFRVEVCRSVSSYVTIALCFEKQCGEVMEMECGLEPRLSQWRQWTRNSNNIYNSILKMVASCTSETSATSPTSTRCNNPRTGSISSVYHILTVYT
jgi:hypothetical protein